MVAVPVSPPTLLGPDSEVRMSRPQNSSIIVWLTVLGDRAMGRASTTGTVA